MFLKKKWIKKFIVYSNFKYLFSNLLFDSFFDYIDIIFWLDYSELLYQNLIYIYLHKLALLYCKNLQIFEINEDSKLSSVKLYERL